MVPRDRFCKITNSDECTVKCNSRSLCTHSFFDNKQCVLLSQHSDNTLFPLENEYTDSNQCRMNCNMNEKCFAHSYHDQKCIHFMGLLNNDNS